MSSDGHSTSLPAAPDAAALALSRVVPGRACDTCTLCCKVIAVEDFAKPPGVWCRHCVRGKGCGIYETRPTDCRTFFCEWMLTPSLGPEWKPERAKFAREEIIQAHAAAPFAVLSGLALSKGTLPGSGALRMHHFFIWPAFGLLIGLALALT